MCTTINRSRVVLGGASTMPLKYQTSTRSELRKAAHEVYHCKIHVQEVRGTRPSHSLLPQMGEQKNTALAAPTHASKTQETAEARILRLEGGNPDQRDWFVRAVVLHRTICPVMYHLASCNDPKIVAECVLRLKTPSCKVRSTPRSRLTRSTLGIGLNWSERVSYCRKLNC